VGLLRVRNIGVRFMYRHFQDVAIAIATSLLILMTVPVPGAAATLIPLEVGTMQGDSSAEVYYGVDQGFFAAEGLDVHITAFNNTAAEAAAASSSAVDIANGGVGTLAVARERGILNSVIAPASVYAAGAPTAMLMVAKDSPYKTAADLNGSVIGTNGLKDQAQLEVMLWLERHGADLKTIKFVEVPFSTMADALAHNRVAAAQIVEPLLTADIGGLRPLSDTMGAVAPNFVSSSWFASDTWLQAHPDIAARFVRAMLRIAVWGNTHRAQSAAILVRTAKLDPGIAAKMTRATYGVSLEPELMQPVLDMFVHFGVLPKTMSAEELVWRDSPAYPKQH
jgi:NitT/TauT family transport system substrate-binding protein